MNKRIGLIAAGLLTALVCVGCGAGKTDDQAVLYTNLADEASQKETAQWLEKGGVSREQTQTLMAWADDFNGRVTSGTLAQGFQKMEKTDYSGLVVENREAPDGEIEPEANCRLTSYLLMKNRIQTNEKREEGDTILIFDEEAIEQKFHLSEEEQKQYVSLFSWVPVQGAETLEEQQQCIQAAWKDREIQIDDGVSLITVYLHLPFDDVRFVGHTGVLAETEDGLLFVEKYGPQLPFQATKFHDRAELKAYLLSRNDLYGDETELPPIVMENDRVM